MEKLRIVPGMEKSQIRGHGFLYDTIVLLLDHINCTESI